MKHRYFLFILAFAFIFSFSQPLFAQEDCPDFGPGSEECNTSAGTTGNSIKLKNPLGGGINDIPTLIENILRIVMTIGVPFIALAIIYAGYLFVAAQGNPEKLKKAKEALVWVIIGAAILLAAYAIATAVSSTIAAIRG